MKLELNKSQEFKHVKPFWQQNMTVLSKFSHSTDTGGNLEESLRRCCHFQSLQNRSKHLK